MTKKNSKLTEAILETADDMLKIGVMSATAHGKITARHLGERKLSTAEPISGEQIRELREKANLSQAALARILNLTVGYISQLERGAKQPSGAALTLFNVIRYKGIAAIL